MYRHENCGGDLKPHKGGQRYKPFLKCEKCGDKVDTGALFQGGENEVESTKVQRRERQEEKSGHH